MTAEALANLARLLMGAGLTVLVVCVCVVLCSLAWAMIRPKKRD